MYFLQNDFCGVGVFDCMAVQTIVYEPFGRWIGFPLLISFVVEWFADVDVGQNVPMISVGIDKEDWTVD
jgi:hypothetical protein